MKKQKLTKLALNKNTISRLKQKAIQGGNGDETSPCNKSLEPGAPCHFDYTY